MVAPRTELDYWPLALKHWGFSANFAAKADDFYGNPRGTWVRTRAIAPNPAFEQSGYKFFRAIFLRTWEFFTLALSPKMKPYR